MDLSYTWREKNMESNDDKARGSHHNKHLSKNIRLESWMLDFFDVFD